MCWDLEEKFRFQELIRKPEDINGGFLMQYIRRFIFF